MKATNGHICVEERKKLLEFEEIFYFHFPRLKRFAFHLLNDEGEAEDLAQEVFVQTWQRLDQLSDKDNLAPYLFTLLKNKCLNQIKHNIVKKKFEYHKAYFESEELYHLSFSGNTDFVSMQEELCRQIDSLIESMPEKCGEVFKLKWVEGKKHREIAEMMKISMTMVDKHLLKGLEIARKKLSPELLMILLYLNV